MVRFVAHEDIRVKGAEAYRRGDSPESNPFLLLGTNKGGHFKSAAWHAGWVEASEKDSEINKKTQHKP